MIDFAKVNQLTDLGGKGLIRIEEIQKLQFPITREMVALYKSSRNENE